LVDVLVRQRAVEVVETASDGTVAAQLLAEATPDLVLVDLVHLVGGTDALAKIHAASPDSTVVALSSEAGSADAPPALANGADAYLHQDVDVERLARAVVEAVLAPKSESNATLPADLSSAAPARELAAQAVRGWDEPDLEATIKLLVTELVTNAVRHAESHVQVKINVDGDVVRVEVRDEDPTAPTLIVADTYAESGRGIALIDTLSSAWGITPASDSKRVWFELRRADHTP